MLPQLQNPASPLAAVLQRSDVWLGDRLAVSRATLASGHPALDAELPGGGWPRGALVDLLHARPGIGELALVLPALAALTAQDEWVVLQAPPQRLFAPAWQAAGVQLARLVVVDALPGSSRLATSDTLWAAEQILRAGSVSAALLWLPRGASSAQLRRLQVAAEAGGTLAFLLQDEARRAAASPAPLRLRLEARPDGLAVHLLKRRGAWLADPVVLPLARQLAGGRLNHRAGAGLVPVAGSLTELFVAGAAEVPAVDNETADVGLPLVRPAEALGSHALARPDFPQAAA